MLPPVPGLGLGMLLSPTAPGTGWLWPRPPAQQAPGLERCWLLARGVPCRAERALILTGDILGGCWRRLCPESQEPRQDEHAAGRGHGAEPALRRGALAGLLAPLQVGPAGGRARPSGWLPGPGRARLPPRACTTRVSGICPAGCRPGRGSLKETGRPRRKLAGQEQQPPARAAAPCAARQTAASPSTKPVRVQGCLATGMPLLLPAVSMAGTGAWGHGMIHPDSDSPCAASAAIVSSSGASSPGC